jgi:hypothetical protein
MTTCVFCISDIAIGRREFVTENSRQIAHRRGLSYYLFMAKANGGKGRNKIISLRQENAIIQGDHDLLMHTTGFFLIKISLVKERRIVLSL